MSKFISFFLLITIPFISIYEVSAYRVPGGSWTQASSYDADWGWRSHRFYNPYATAIFVPGQDDAGNYNYDNFFQITWNKWRPGSIRIHTIVPLSGGDTTNCPGSAIGDTLVNYWGTYGGWQRLGGATTVLAENDWTNRLPYSWKQDFTSGELRCDFGANYQY